MVIEREIVAMRVTGDHLSNEVLDVVLKNNDDHLSNEVLDIVLLSNGDQ